MSKPLLDAVKAHANSGAVSFHTPGHKGNATELEELLSLKYDLTELTDTDELFMPKGVIAQAERLASHLFNTSVTCFSAGGCSLCIQTMLRLVCKREGTKIIAGRNIHRSAVNAMALLGAEPIWLNPVVSSKEPMLPGRIHARDVGAALEQNRDAAAVYITTPDYYGCISDVREISKVCRQYAAFLLVDRAHGSHLPFIGQTAEVISGADMYADSAHKTMPVLTGGAWLNIYNKLFSCDAKGAMALFASTSPAYPVMSSLDYAREWLEKSGKNEWEATSERVQALKQTAKQKGFTLPGGACDPTRLTIGTYFLGIRGQSAAKYFENKGIYPEYADDGYVVFIVSPFNSEDEIGKLKQAIEEFNVKEKDFTHKKRLDYIPKRIYSLRESLFAPKRRVNIAELAGRVAGEILCPCPPGVPVLMPGELADENTAKILAQYGIREAEIIDGALEL